MFSNKNSYIQFSFRMTRQGLPRSSVEMSVMDMERRGGHTQATEIIQLLNKREFDEIKIFASVLYLLAESQWINTNMQFDNLTR